MYNISEGLEQELCRKFDDIADDGVFQRYGTLLGGVKTLPLFK